jgi:hypothetical protein
MQQSKQPELTNVFINEAMVTVLEVRKAHMASDCRHYLIKDDGIMAAV